MFASSAHCCAAARIHACQTAGDPNRALNVENRLLAMPAPRYVPSCSKVIVIKFGCGQAFPDTLYGTIRVSNISTVSRDALFRARFAARHCLIRFIVSSPESTTLTQDHVRPTSHL